MFLFGLRDRDLIWFIVQIVFIYFASLFFAFLLPPLGFYACVVAATGLSVWLILRELVRRYPVITFGRPHERIMAFPRNVIHRRIAYYYASTGTLFFTISVLILSSRSGHIQDLSEVWAAAFFLAFGYPGVVQLAFLRLPISHLEEHKNLQSASGNM